MLINSITFDIVKFIRYFLQFNVTRNLTFAFIDSFSQTWPGIDDQTQQVHWEEETRKLWIEATSKNETFDFKTIGKYFAGLKQDL